MSEVNPMTDLGVYTYTEVFETSQQSQVHYQTKKKEFHESYLLGKYPPGIHEVTGEKSIIKYFDIFSNADIDVLIENENRHINSNGEIDYDQKRKYDTYKNSRIYREKSYYDPIVTFVDTNYKYYNYNTGDKLPSGITIKLIIVQIAHIPFDYSLLQKKGTDSIQEYTDKGYFSYNGFYIYSWSLFYSVWQIHALPRNVYIRAENKTVTIQNPFYIDVYYYTLSWKRLTFFSSVFYLPAYLKQDRNFYISLGWINTLTDEYKKVKITPDAELPVFNVYKYPYFYFTFGILSYNFDTNNNDIFTLTDKQRKLYFKSKIVLYNKEHNIEDLKNNDKPKIQKKNDAEKELEIDEEMIKNSRPFVRINTKPYFLGNNERLIPGAHNFKEKDFGSMVIYPGYEVQLWYKRIIQINEDFNEEVYDDVTEKYKTVTHTKKITTTENQINTEIYTDQKVEFKNTVKLIKLILRPINNNENKTKTEKEKEKENDFSVFFYVIIIFIGMLILFFITVTVLKKKRIDI